MVITDDFVAQGIAVVFCSERQGCGHEEQTVDVQHILRTGNVGEIARPPIGFQRILEVGGCRSLAGSSVIAFARDMLK